MGPSCSKKSVLQLKLQDIQKKKEEAASTAYKLGLLEELMLEPQKAILNYKKALVLGFDPEKCERGIADAKKLARQITLSHKKEEV